MKLNPRSAWPKPFRATPLQPACPEKGFTLIEIVLVMSIFSIGILAIMTLHVGAIRSNATARDILMGSTLLADRFEKLISADYASAGLNPGEAASQAENGFVVEHRIFTTPIAQIKKIELEVILDTDSASSFKVTYYKRSPG